MTNSVARINRILRQRLGSGVDVTQAKKALATSRNSTDTVQEITRSDTQLGLPIGRQGNDWPTPDNEAILFNTDPGKRQQDFANTHLSEGPNPGRVPRFWNDRRLGKVGRHITGTPSGDNYLTLGSGPAGGLGDDRYIQHVQVPRGSMVARAFARTVDDAANVPAVYVGDPTRR